jgi:hypothetical protein
MIAPKAVYAISIPVVPANTQNFKIKTSVLGLTYTFNFMWQPTNGATQAPFGQWRGYATMPDQSIRWFGVNPNAMNWSGYPDVGVSFNTKLQWIGLNDWAKVSMYLVTWR